MSARHPVAEAIGALGEGEFATYLSSLSEALERHGGRAWTPATEADLWELLAEALPPAPSRRRLASVHQLARACTLDNP